ncbi:hypothetical protein J6590_047785 [Homalodisca vitripennis]|nr:hypothetical protein J6590_047785 [Homalodisca vitripennis]
MPEGRPTQCQADIHWPTCDQVTCTFHVVVFDSSVCLLQVGYAFSVLMELLKRQTANTTVSSSIAVQGYLY